MKKDHWVTSKKWVQQVVYRNEGKPLSHISASIVTKYSVVLLIYSVTCWPTLEKNRMNALNATKSFRNWALCEVTCWHTQERNHTNALNATRCFYDWAIYSVTCWPTLERNSMNALNATWNFFTIIQSTELLRKETLSECEIFTIEHSAESHADPYWRETTWMLWMRQEVFTVRHSTTSHADPYWKETTRMLWMPQVVFTVKYSTTPHGNPHWRETAQMHCLSK